MTGSMFRRLLTLALVALVLAGLGTVAGVQAAGETVEVKMTAADDEYRVGEQFTVAVACSKLDGGGTPVEGAFSCYLKHTFDPAVLQLNDVVYNATYSNFNDRQEINNTTGEVDKAGATATVVVVGDVAQAPAEGTSVYELVFDVVGGGVTTITSEAVAASDPFSEITILGSDEDQRDISGSILFDSLEIESEPIDTNLNLVSLISPRNTIPSSDLLALKFYGQPDTTAHSISVYYPGEGTPFYADTVDTTGCADAECVVEVPYDGRLGQYDVWIIPFVGGINGEWNQSIFEVTGEGLRDVYLENPVGMIPAGNEVMLEFYAQQGTTDHAISLYNYNETPSLLYADVADTSHCAGDMCRVKVPTNGITGLYGAILRPLAGSVGGNYTASYFTVGDDALRYVDIISPESMQLPSDELVLEFKEVPGATSYNYNFRDPSSNLFGQGVMDAVNCADGLCRTVVDYDGTEGLYSVAVQALAGTSGGPWRSQFFEVKAMDLNPVPLMEPQGVVPVSNDLMLEFGTQAGTTKHTITLSGPGGVVYQETLTSEDCPDNWCAVPVHYDGAVGTYQAEITPYADQTMGPATTSEFEVANIALVPVKLLSPKGEVAATNLLTLKFDGQPGTTMHHITAYGPGGLIYDEKVDTRWCAGSVCTVKVPYDGTTGSYQVWIQPVAVTPATPWAYSQFFVSNALQPVSLETPQGTIQSYSGGGLTEMTLTFQTQPGVTSHNIDLYGPGGLVYSGTVLADECNLDGTCVVVVPYDGAAGSYQAWIQPMAGPAGGPWNDSLFSVAELGGLNAVSLLSPTGTILPSDVLTLKFQAQQGTTNHHINVYRGVTLISQQILDTTDCVGDVCTVYVPYDGTEAGYSAWILPRAGQYYGSWNGSYFTVASGSFDLVNLNSPQGTIVPGDLFSLLFDTQGGTTSHLVTVTGPSGVIYSQNVNTVDCSGSECEVVVPYSGAAGGYTVGITPYVGTTSGTNNDSTFTVGASLAGVSLSSPTGAIAPSSQLVLEFPTQGGTTAHRLDVYGPGGTVSSKVYDTTGCAGGTCSVTVPYDGAEGTYTVWILPYAGNVTGPWSGSNFQVTSVPAEYLSENLNLSSVCAGTWEVSNPLGEAITLDWEAYFETGDVDTGTVTVGATDTATFYTDVDVTGVSLIIDGGADVYAEAGSLVCEAE